jgi:GDP-mannose transporter
MVSATTYTLVGVVNKFITVLLNVMIWDKHSTPLGISAVCLCLLAGSFYQQAPKREVVSKDRDTEPLMRKV